MFQIESLSLKSIYLNTMKFFLIYNNFFYTEFENKTENKYLRTYSPVSFIYICFFSCQNCKKSKPNYQKVIG